MTPQESRAIQREAAKRDMVNCQQALTDFGPHLSGDAAKFVEQLREALAYEASLDEPVTAEWMRTLPSLPPRLRMRVYFATDDVRLEIVERCQETIFRNIQSRRRVYAILEAFDVELETKEQGR